METVRNESSPEDLTQKLNETFGDICSLEKEAPGVYYMTAHGFGEVYLVDRASPAISDEVKGYGKAFSDFPDFLYYPFKEAKSGSKLVAYELEKYAAGQRFPEHDSASLRAVAVFAAEYHPEFFGTYPVPLYTPWGSTIRHKCLENGIYWLETDQCQEVLTICYPIWDASLSVETVSLGAVTEYDHSHNINTTLGYLFYRKADACIPIFELLKIRQSWSRTGKIAVPALMNAIWQNHPGYALNHNIRELAGMNDAVNWLLRQFGMELPPDISLENMISLFPDAGIEYLRF